MTDYSLNLVAMGENFSPKNILPANKVAGGSSLASVLRIAKKYAYGTGERVTEWRVNDRSPWSITAGAVAHRGHRILATVGRYYLVISIVR